MLLLPMFLDQTRYPITQQYASKSKYQQRDHSKHSKSVNALQSTCTCTLLCPQKYGDVYSHEQAKRVVRDNCTN